MTAADLSGRDLDVAVARAFGWEWVDVPPDYRGHHSGRVLVRSVSGFLASGADFPKVGKLVESFYVPRYSTDPATLDEMNQWLSAHDTFPPTLTLRRVVDDERTSSTIWTASMRSSYEDGTTINLAFARLVVAVKEAMGDG